MTNLINYIIIGLRVKPQKLENWKPIKPIGEILITKKVEEKASKLAIIFTSGGGSSWAQGSDEDNHVLAYRAGKHFKQSWKHMFKFKKAGEQRLCVHLYDISKADYAGNITCLESKQDCPYIQKIYVVV